MISQVAWRPMTYIHCRLRIAEIDSNEESRDRTPLAVKIIGQGCSQKERWWEPFEITANILKISFSNKNPSQDFFIRRDIIKKVL